MERRWLVVAFSLFTIPAVIYCQSEVQDSLPRYTVETVVVTGDRVENTVAGSTSSVSVLPGKDIRQLPVTKVGDALQFVPGFTVVSMDGIGRNPIVSARGFYGGGEAEYNIVLLDGLQINDLETGLVDWNLVPLQNIESVEIARGGASPLYGDAALGSVVNIITRGDLTPRTSASLSGGSFSSFNAGFNRRGVVGENAYSLHFSNEKTSGFRMHSAWRGTNLGGDAVFPLGGGTALRFFTMNQWVKRDEPGPLTAPEVQAGRSGSSAYYRNDGSDERRHQFQAALTNPLSDAMEVRLNAHVRAKNGIVMRTFTNPSPKFDSAFQYDGFYDTTFYGDTKERDLGTLQVGGRGQLILRQELGAMHNRTVLGVDGEYGRLKSSYYRAFQGFEEDYKQGVGKRGELVSDGRTTRSVFAMYASNEFRPLEPLTIALGARYDAISDRSNATLWDSVDTDIRTKHTAFSPKAGVNIRLAGSRTYSGNIYASFNRSFKAGTLDQLAEQRPITAAFFIPAGPNSYMQLAQDTDPISNSMLRPQQGTSFELGTYQRLAFGSQSAAELTLSVYHTEMKDEIDFDLATVKYQNIGRSRHKGVEAGLRVYWLPNLMSFANHTISDVTFRSGDNVGKQLKSIPKNTTSVGAMYEHDSGMRTSLVWTFIGSAYLDDENTSVLGSYHSGSLRMAYRSVYFTVFADVENILDRKYSSTGYMLYGTTFLFPSAGRSFRGGVSVEL